MTVQMQVDRRMPPGPAVSEGARRRARRAQRARESIFGFLMISPGVVFVTVFTMIPIIATIVLSFFSWDVITPPKFTGIGNYQKLLGDDAAIKSFGVTLVLAFGIVILQLMVGLALALLVEQRRKAWSKGLFRTVFYLPLLASTAAVSIFMGYMFDDKFGVINYYLTTLGASGVPWLINSTAATITMILIVVWQQSGFTFVLFAAALSSLPTDVMEAAAIDGAGPIRALLRVKLPLISPTVLFAAVIAMINAMQLFDQPFIMTKGGPGTATTTATITLYQDGFENLRFGYASAIAVVLLAIILAITGLQFLAARKLVFYQ